MSISLGFFLIFGAFWVIFLACKSLVNIILNWILSLLVKKAFPLENLQITVEDFGYFCANGVSVHINKTSTVRIGHTVLQLLWEDFRLKLQSTAEDITLEIRHSETSSKHKKGEVLIKGSLTIGINLFSFDPPTDLLCIAPETEQVHGVEIKISELTPVWLFARDGKASVQGKIDGDVVSYDLTVSNGSALVLYNSNMARLIFLFKNAHATFSPNVNGNTNGVNTKVALSEGLILVYKIEDGILTSSHIRLKHTEVNLIPSTISNLEYLVSNYVTETFEGSLDEEDILETSIHETSSSNGEIPNERDEKCEVAFEAESITINVYSSERSKHFELRLACVSLSTTDDIALRWSVSVPFELMFMNEISGGERESVIGSKIKSEGLVNPCVLKLEGEEISRKRTSWVVSFHEGILVQIKPQHVNTLETFIKAYKSRCCSIHAPTIKPQAEALVQNCDSKAGNDDGPSPLDHELNKVKCRREGMCKISASICDITIDVKDVYDQDLLQILFIRPEFSLSQDRETRSLSFKVETLKGFNCVENIPFFYPTDELGNEKDKTASLELSITENLSNDSNKLSFERFTFGSCDTTVVVEETLIFAILKYFGLHKKVAQIFLESRGEGSAEALSPPSKRFYFDHIELRAVEVILTLLPAIDLPAHLKVVKESLGIPHQLPPRFENACLYFDPFVRNNIQYGSYKYISYDIKNHYLKELGSQSARVLGSMHLFGNISRLKQDIMSGFTTLRETGEFITFFRKVTTGVASSYSKFTGSWSDLFGLTSPSHSVQDPGAGHERRHSDPCDIDVAVLRQLSATDERCNYDFAVINRTPRRKAKDDSAVLGVDEDSGSAWSNSSFIPDITNETDGLNWDTESSDGEGNLRIPLDLIPRNVKRQLKGQEFLRRLKENLGDNEHGEVFSCCFKVRQSVVENKLNALLSNRKVYFLKGQPSHESLVLCVKYETLYKAQYIFQDKTHYIQLMSKMKGIRTLSIPSRSPGESPLVRCDNMVIARKVSNKINELKRAYDHEYMHSQHQ